MTAARASVIWHDLECGRYRQDLSLWLSLAARHGDPVLEIGAGTGRVTLALVRAGHDVTALDNDPVLLAELAHRAAGLNLETVLADARDFELQREFALCIVPMQTIQLLAGPSGRANFLRCARRCLTRGGMLAVAIAQTLETYERRAGLPPPHPDVDELEGVVYSSQPTAVRAESDGFVLERRREIIDAAGASVVQLDVVRLDRLTVELLEGEARAAALRPVGTASIADNDEYAGSEVVMLSG